MINKRSAIFFITLLLGFISLKTFSADIDRWNSRISYSANINKIVQNGEYIYSLTDGKLFIYNNGDDSFEEAIKKEGGNTDITHIELSPKQKCLVATRTDGTIELIYGNGKYQTILDLKETDKNIDKTVNEIFCDGNFAYLSTNFGFITVNLEKKEIKESGIFSLPFYSMRIWNNKIYAATKDGLIRTDLNKNIQDFANWEKVSINSDNNSDFDTKEIKKIELFENKLSCLIPQKGVYILSDQNSLLKLALPKEPIAMTKSSNNHLIIWNQSSLYDYEDLSKSENLNIENLIYAIPNSNKSNQYWIASAGNNLSLIKKENSSFEYLKRWKCPQGPVSNLPFSQTYSNGQLIVTPGGFYTDRYFKPAGLSIFKDNKWNNLYTSDITSQSGLNALDFVYAISDPKNPEHFFVSSWGEGLYEFLNGKFMKLYNKDNSTIEELQIKDSLNGDFQATRVSGMAYDKDNNLWILNSMVKNTIKIHKNNGQWDQLYFKETDKAKTNTKKILIDRYGNKWVSTIGQENTGDNYLLIVNGSKYIYVNSFFDQSNNNLFIIDINDLTEDNNGDIWLSTNIGPFFIRNSSTIINSTKIVLEKKKIRKEVGSNSIVGLLEDVYINAMAVDGANQKWIATQSSGVYLLNADNSEILEHFTLENSPLPSNNIISLAIDDKGEVFFGSDRGLMSYKAGVTKAAENFSDVYAYPNPVKPDYIGIINITGLMLNSHVKITDLKGNLIIEGNSLGGQFSWDGLNAKGNRVDTGVYLVFGSSQNGEKGVVTKIMFINH